jgi:D-alanine transaminase
LIRRNQLETTWGLVYIQITRGAAPRTHAFPVPAVRPTIYAYAAPVVPKYDAEKGVSVITVADMRWGRCDLKTVNLLPNCWANQRAREAGAFEAIFVRDGIALEGSHTGLFAVLDETVCTCPNSNYILPSVTRELVLELCRDHGIAVAETPIRIEDLRRASEVFLVGTTSEVLPVIQLDGRPVGPGIPGATTQQLQSLFRELTKAGSTPARAGRA